MNKIQQCFECDSLKNLVQHHVVPKSRGGKRTVTLCQICHDKVHGLKLRDISMSQLVKDALVKAKTRGVQLGNPILHKARLNAIKQVQAQKVHFALSIYPKILDIKTRGFTSLNKISQELNRLGILSPRKGLWTSTSVKRILVICQHNHKKIINE